MEDKSEETYGKVVWSDVEEANEGHRMAREQAEVEGTFSGVARVHETKTVSLPTSGGPVLYLTFSPIVQPWMRTCASRDQHIICQ